MVAEKEVEFGMVSSHRTRQQRMPVSDDDGGGNGVDLRGVMVGLTPATSYQFSVAAVNAVGPGTRVGLGIRS